MILAIEVTPGVNEEGFGFVTLAVTYAEDDIVKIVSSQLPPEIMRHFALDCFISAQTSEELSAALRSNNGRSS